MGTKGENTKRFICNTAEQLFSKKGYTGVSMQMICDATGLSKGGLYRHFGSKEEILLEKQLMIGNFRNFGCPIQENAQVCVLCFLAVFAIEKARYFFHLKSGYALYWHNPPAAAFFIENVYFAFRKKDRGLAYLFVIKTGNQQ